MRGPCGRNVLKDFEESKRQSREAIDRFRQHMEDVKRRNKREEWKKEVQPIIDKAKNCIFNRMKMVRENPWAVEQLQCSCNYGYETRYYSSWRIPFSDECHYFKPRTIYDE